MFTDRLLTHDHARWNFTAVMLMRVARGLSAVGLLVGGTTTMGGSASAAVRDPADVVAWVNARTPAEWTSAIGEVTWHVGELFRTGAAMEADCSGGTNDGPLIGFSDAVYTQSTSTYWRQAYAHEYGHVVLCHALSIDPTALDVWMWSVGELRGAPNYYEMFSQCWARLVTGNAPRGYAFRCRDRRAWDATLVFAAEGPPTAPSIPQPSPGPRVEQDRQSSAAPAPVTG